MLRISRVIAFPVFYACFEIGKTNYEWENKLKIKLKLWYEAHEEYRRAVKMVSKSQSDKMSKAGESASGILFNPSSPQKLIQTVQHVKSSYSGINRAIVDDLIRQTQQSVKSSIVSHDAINCSISDEDYNALDNINTSIEDREEILQRHVGLKSSYKSFLISMASAKENAARADMLEALESKPYTFITDNDDTYLLNTKYMFGIGVLGCILSGSFLLVGERAVIVRAIRALLSM
jgi:hypothetical protein